MKDSILSPELAARNAWARTLELSSSDRIQGGEEARRAKNQMDGLLKRARSEKETRYVNEVYSAIESTFRTLVTARNGYDVNSGEVQKLRDKKIADLEHATTFSSNLQSLIPRLATMTITSTVTGGALFAAILQNVFGQRPDIEAIFVPLILGAGAAIGYFLHGLVIVPITASKARRQLVKTDYDKILYYRLYYNRTKDALIALYNTTNSLYEKIFESGKYSTDNAEEVVKNVLAGMNLKDYMCPNLPEHIDKYEIEADTWVKCETGLNVEKCNYHPNYKGNPTDGGFVASLKRVIRKILDIYSI